MVTYFSSSPLLELLQSAYMYGDLLDWFTQMDTGSLIKEAGNQVGAQSEKLKASEQGEMMMSPSPRPKAWLLPGEPLV
jgi:hypothetical protein